MLKYFNIHKDKGYTELRYREKRRIFDEPTKELRISKKKNIAIYGTSGAGKSLRLEQLKNKAHLLWSKDEVIFFKGTDSISEMLHKNLGENTAEYLNEEDLEVIDVKKQYIQIQALIEKAKKSTVFIDDLDSFTGKKLEILKDITRKAKRLIYTAEDKHAINRTIRHILIKKGNFFEIQLKAETSKDATNILFAFVVIVLFVTGYMEAAVLVMAGRFVMKGSK